MWYFVSFGFRELTVLKNNIEPNWHMSTDVPQNLKAHDKVDEKNKNWQTEIISGW